jgi:hypothetical protein
MRNNIVYWAFIGNPAQEVVHLLIGELFVFAIRKAPCFSVFPIDRECPRYHKKAFVVNSENITLVFDIIDVWILLLVRELRAEHILDDERLTPLLIRLPITIVMVPTEYDKLARLGYHIVEKASHLIATVEDTHVSRKNDDILRGQRDKIR